MTVVALFYPLISVPDKGKRKAIDSFFHAVNAKKVKEEVRFVLLLTIAN